MALPFTAPWLLAPMEGVTEPSFRGLVLERNPPHTLGGTFTEFVRVVAGPVPPRVLERHLGHSRDERPVGLQLMGRDVEALAASARRAFDVGAPLVDLNFGCPAKGALRGCAGSALLDDPAALERIVAACAQALPPGRVTAKIRAGVSDDARLEDLCRAAAAGGAALLTVHCRTRHEGYAPEPPWSRIARAVQAVDIPVCGNGGVGTHADLERMRRETGCAYVMVGRAALQDPWIFSGHLASAKEGAHFLLEYAQGLMQQGASPGGAASRIKQLVQSFDVGDLLDPKTRREKLRERDPASLLHWLREAAGGPYRRSSSPPLESPARQSTFS